MALSVNDLFSHSSISAMGKLIDSKLKKDPEVEVKSLEPTVDLKKEVDLHDQRAILEYVRSGLGSHISHLPASYCMKLYCIKCLAWTCSCVHSGIQRSMETGGTKPECC